MNFVKPKVLNEQEVLGKQFRVYGTAEEPLFLAKDVAEWIEYDTSSVHKMLANVDDDEKVRKNVPTLGGTQESWCLTENGLYEVLMQSRKPIAKQFKKEVKEILNTIRKHGIYATDNVIDNILNNPDFGIELLIKLKEERAARVEAERKNAKGGGGIMNYTDFSEDERKFYLSESGFDSREKEFFRLRVYEEKTLFETAEIMGYSPRTIDRINRKVKKKIVKVAPMYYRGFSLHHGENMAK